MKRSYYEAPMLRKREQLSAVTAEVISPFLPPDE